MTGNPIFISASEAAALAGVTQETIRNLCKAATLRYQMHGNFYYPCKEDVEQYAQTIAEIHQIEQSLDLYKSRLQNQTEQLLQTKKETQHHLQELLQFPSRLKYIQNLLAILIPHLNAGLTPREVEVMLQMVQGKTWAEITEKLKLTQTYTLQLWKKALDKIAAAPNEIQAKNKLIDELRAVIDEKQVKKAQDQAEKEAEAKLTPEQRKLLHTPVSECGFSVRVENGLKAADVTTVRQLLKKKRSELLKFRNFGKKSFAEVEAWLIANNLTLQPE